MEDKNITYPRMLGKVSKWFPEKGYGFIRSWENGESYFVHVSKCNDGVLEKGTVVEFSVGTDKKDPEKHFAMKVQTVEVPEDRK